MSQLLILKCERPDAASSSGPEASESSQGVSVRSGRIEFSDLEYVHGWAVDRGGSSQPVALQVVADGRAIASITTSIPRWDLPSPCDAGSCHGFVYPLPASLRDGARHELSIHFSRTGEQLENSPIVIQAPAESVCIPTAPTSLIGHRVLVLAPHPDDESLACGGAVSLHCDNRDSVKVVVLTDGRRAAPAGCQDLGAWVARRQTETRTACAVLGTADIEFWGISDRELESRGVSLDRLLRLLDEYRPTLVYAPSPLEFHPDHQAAARLLWQALQNATVKPRVAFYEVNRPLNANLLVDITPVISRKLEACNAHQSQQALRSYTECMSGLNRYRALTLPGGCTHAEAYHLLQCDDIAGRQIEEQALAQFLPALSPRADGRPLVSIVIRTRNRLELLRQALTSVLAQTWRQLEVVVVNDGGQDATAVLQPFADSLRIRYHANPAARGRSAAANTGVELSRGKYLNFLDDDDVLHPGHVEKLATFLERTGEPVAYSDCAKADYVWKDGTFARSGECRLFCGIDFDRDRLFASNFIPIMTVMFTRDAWKLAGGCDESLQWLEDWDLWLRMSEHSTFHRLPGITAEYRRFAQHPTNPEDTLRVQQKHATHWTLDRLVNQTLPRMARLQDEVSSLRERAHFLDEELGNVRSSHAALARELTASHLARDALALDLGAVRSNGEAAACELAAIRTSRGWHFLEGLRRWRVRLLPSGSRRERWALSGVDQLRRLLHR